MRCLVVALIVLAGCTTPETPDLLSGDTIPEITGNAPLTQAMYMHDCQQVVLIFHVDLDTLQSFLPEGYEAIPAEEQYAQLGLPLLPAISGKGWFFIEAHGCAMEAGGMAHVDINQQIAIRHADRDADMPFATVLAYELERGGSSPFVQFWSTHGKKPFADEVEFELTDAGVHRTASAVASLGGEVKLSFEVPAIPENPLEVEDAYGRTWTQAPNGTILLGWDSGEHKGAPVNAYIGGPPPTCSFAEDTVAAQILGATTCAGAIRAGHEILPLSPEIHDMNVTWNHLPV